MRDHGLDEARRLLRGGFGDAEDLLDELGLGGHPAETAARSHGLGEGVEADDAALVVDGEEGRDQGVEEGVAGRLGGVEVLGARLRIDGRGWYTAHCCRKFVCGWILEVPVWIVFDDDHVVVDADLVNGFAPGDTKDPTSRVLTYAC